MNFELDEGQMLLQLTARDFFSGECPKELVRQIIDNRQGHASELWRKMAELGWFGMIFPEEDGGYDLSFSDLAVLLEEFGRALCPSPFISSVVLGGRIIQATGTEQQKADLFPGLISGDTIITVGFMDSSTTPSLSDIKTTATPYGDSYIVNGIKLFIPYAHVADYMVCAARTSDTSDSETGITLFLIDLNSDGITRDLLETTTGDKLCKVVFNDVTVSGECILGELDSGWAIIRNTFLEAAVAESARMVGSARWALETTINYVKERKAFGQPVGSFQAVQHKLADIALEIEAAEALVLYAAWTISEHSPDRQMAASMAKAWCNDAFRHATYEGIQLHGGMGFTWEHDMHLYLKQAKVSEVMYGNTSYHQETVARLLEI